jgi:hypothetical protein
MGDVVAPSQARAELRAKRIAQGANALDIGLTCSEANMPKEGSRRFSSKYAEKTQLDERMPRPSTPKTRPSILGNKTFNARKQDLEIPQTGRGSIGTGAVGLQPEMMKHLAAIGPKISEVSRREISDLSDLALIDSATLKPEL